MPTLHYYFIKNRVVTVVAKGNELFFQLKKSDEEKNYRLKMLPLKLKNGLSKTTYRKQLHDFKSGV